MILFIRSVLWDLDIPQEAATLLYEDNDGCTAMGNAQKPTPRTRHMTSNTSPCVNGLNETSSSLIGLTLPSTCLTTSPNLYKHYSSTDALTSSSTYSPVYSTLVGSYSNHTIDVDKFTPHNFTTPLTAAAARVYAPIKADYAYSLWLHILGHGETIQCSDDSFPLSSSLNLSFHTGLWGGVTIGS